MHAASTAVPGICYGGVHADGVLGTAEHARFAGLRDIKVEDMSALFEQAVALERSNSASGGGGNGGEGRSPLRIGAVAADDGDEAASRSSPRAAAAASASGKALHSSAAAAAASSSPEAAAAEEEEEDVAARVSQIVRAADAAAREDAELLQLPPDRPPRGTHGGIVFLPAPPSAPSPLRQPPPPPSMTATSVRRSSRVRRGGGGGVPRPSTAQYCCGPSQRRRAEAVAARREASYAEAEEQARVAEAAAAARLRMADASRVFGPAYDEGVSHARQKRWAVAVVLGASAGRLLCGRELLAEAAAAAARRRTFVEVVSLCVTVWRAVQRLRVLRREERPRISQALSRHPLLGPLFSAWSPRWMDALARTAVRTRHAPGQCVTLPGEWVAACYVVVAGQAQRQKAPAAAAAAAAATGSPRVHFASLARQASAVSSVASPLASPRKDASRMQFASLAKQLSKSPDASATAAAAPAATPEGSGAPSATQASAAYVPGGGAVFDSSHGAVAHAAGLFLLHRPTQGIVALPGPDVECYALTYRRFQRVCRLIREQRDGEDVPGGSVEAFAKLFAEVEEHVLVTYARQELRLTVGVLATSPVFAHLSLATCSELCSDAVPVLHPAGSVLAQQGETAADAAPALHIVAEGFGRVERAGKYPGTESCPYRHRVDSRDRGVSVTFDGDGTAAAEAAAAAAEAAGLPAAKAPTHVAFNIIAFPEGFDLCSTVTACEERKGRGSAADERWEVSLLRRGSVVGVERFVGRAAEETIVCTQPTITWLVPLRCPDPGSAAASPGNSGSEMRLNSDEHDGVLSVIEELRTARVGLLCAGPELSAAFLLERLACFESVCARGSAAAAAASPQAIKEHASTLLSLQPLLRDVLGTLRFRWLEAGRRVLRVCEGEVVAWCTRGVVSLHGGPAAAAAAVSPATTTTTTATVTAATNKVMERARAFQFTKQVFADTSFSDAATAVLEDEEGRRMRERTVRSHTGTAVWYVLLRDVAAVVAAHRVANPGVDASVLGAPPLQVATSSARTAAAAAADLPRLLASPHTPAWFRHHAGPAAAATAADDPFRGVLPPYTRAGLAARCDLPGGCTAADAAGRDGRAGALPAVRSDHPLAAYAAAVVEQEQLARRLERLRRDVSQFGVATRRSLHAELATLRPFLREVRDAGGVRALLNPAGPEEARRVAKAVARHKARLEGRRTAATAASPPPAEPLSPTLSAAGGGVRGGATATASVMKALRQKRARERFLAVDREEADPAYQVSAFVAPMSNRERMRPLEYLEKRKKRRGWYKVLEGQRDAVVAELRASTAQRQQAAEEARRMHGVSGDEGAAGAGRPPPLLFAHLTARMEEEDERKELSGFYFSKEFADQSYPRGLPATFFDHPLPVEDAPGNGFSSEAF